MTLMKYSPFEELGTLREQINRMFEPAMLSTEGRYGTYSLPAEVTETPTQYLVRVMVPGVDPQQIQLEATQKELTVSYQTEVRNLEEGERLHLNQFQYGKFAKSLTFPELIDNNRIEARYKHGVLTVTLLKSESVQRKAIEIKVPS
jgi:HSP20 family protein